MIEGFEKFKDFMSYIESDTPLCDELISFLINDCVTNYTMHNNNYYIEIQLKSHFTNINT